MVFQSVSEIGDLIPGKRLADRYEIVKANRQGGLSVAFEVLDLSDGSPREMQFFPSSLFDGEREARDFASSWEPWRRVDSPHVLALREILPVGSSSLFLIHDVPSGACLRDKVEKGERVEAAQVIDLGLQLLDGLSEIHAHGLVHGDVKPTTVFVDRGGESGDGWAAQLVDGGTTHGLWTAKDLGERTALIGTPYYAPVEQFGGDPPTVQSDLYNVATLLFELVSGAQPWAGKSFLEVFQAKLERTPPTIGSRAPGVEVDPELEATIAGGLHAELDSRYAAAREFRDRLAACAS